MTAQDGPRANRLSKRHVSYLERVVDSDESLNSEAEYECWRHVADRTVDEDKCFADDRTVKHEYVPESVTQSYPSCTHTINHYFIIQFQATCIDKDVTIDLCRCQS